MPSAPATATAPAPAPPSPPTAHGTALGVGSNSTAQGPVVLVLASGQGRRFRESGATVHKLRARLGQGTVLGHTLAAVQASGLAWHLEDRGHPGMGDSIAAAVRATADAPGWLVLPGDLPLIAPGTLRTLAGALRSAPVAAPRHGGQRGHPVAFSAACRAALLALSGEEGAARIVQAHAQAGQLLWLDVDDAGTVLDVDTLADLERAEGLLQTRR